MEGNVVGLYESGLDEDKMIVLPLSLVAKFPSFINNVKTYSL